MVRIVAGLFLGVLMVGAEAVTAAEAKKALCPVCRVMEGEDDPEKVKAHRFHDGVEYGFCSNECAKKFDADPVAFLPPVFPRPAPPFSVRGLGGNERSSSGLEGKVVLVDFWATWCVPCRKSMPELQTLQDEFADRGFTVVGISIDEEKHAKRVEKFIADKDIRYPVAMDLGDAPAWDAYRVKAIPATFLIDGEGQIVAQWTGKSAGLNEVRAKLEALLPEVQP